MTPSGPVGSHADRDMASTVSERWIRSQRAAVADIGECSYLVARDGVVRRLDGDTASLARVLLAFLARPRHKDEVVPHLESLTGPLGESQVATVLQLLTLLVETGVIVTAHEAPRLSSGTNIVVCISGAIAATHAPALVGALQRRGHTVEVALTQAASRFVAIDALAAIAGREIHTSLWPKTPHAPVPHVALAHWADLVVVYPASGTTVGRIASGDFSDLVSAIALTTRAPVVVAPSMNLDMLAAPAVQRNLEQLRTDGFMIIDGVPSQEVADAPSVRGTLARVAPPPGELVVTIEALRRAGALVRRDGDAPRRAVTAADWDAVYHAYPAAPRTDTVPLVPWASDACDADIATAIDRHATAPARVLDVGCGLGQIARHAHERGHTVVATDLSEVALHVAMERAAADRSITWLRDDICASHLIGAFDVIVDRATLHALPDSRVHAWAQAMRRLTTAGSTLIVKAHRDGVPSLTTGWSPGSLVGRLPDFELVESSETTLPGLRDSTPLPAILAVFRRR